MNFIPLLFNPFTSGYIYGTSIALTKDGIDKNITESPLITTIDIATTGCIYGLSAELGSKVIFPEKAKYAMSGVLIAVAGYKLYKFMKNKYSKKLDDIEHEKQTREDNENNEENEDNEDNEENDKVYCTDGIKHCKHSDVILCECIG